MYLEKYQNSYNCKKKQKKKAKNLGQLGKVHVFTKLVFLTRKNLYFKRKKNHFHVSGIC